MPDLIDILRSVDHQMLSRSELLRRGVTEDQITGAEENGRVAIGEGGSFASVILLHQDDEPVLSDVVRAGLDQPLDRDEAKALLGRVLTVMRERAEARGDRVVVAQMSVETDTLIDRIDALGTDLDPLEAGPVVSGLPRKTDAAEQHRESLRQGFEPSVVRRYAEHHLGRLRELPSSGERARAITELETFLQELS